MQHWTHAAALMLAVTPLAAGATVVQYTDNSAFQAALANTAFQQALSSSAFQQALSSSAFQQGLSAAFLQGLMQQAQAANMKND